MFDRQLAGDNGGRDAVVVSDIVLESCGFLRLRELGTPACIAHWQVELLLVFAVPAFQSIIGLVTQLPDGGPDPFAELDVELDGANSVWIGIHALPPSSPSFR